LAIFCAREELTYAYEMERCQKLRRETKELALQAAQSCKRYVEGNAFAVIVFFCCFFYLLTHCSSRRQCAAKQELTALQSAMAPEEAEELQRHTWYGALQHLLLSPMPQN
jgi:hypothetical protein